MYDELVNWRVGWYWCYFLLWRVMTMYSTYDVSFHLYLPLGGALLCFAPHLLLLLGALPAKMGKIPRFLIVDMDRIQ